jgi:hypothetical protein
MWPRDLPGHESGAADRACGGRWRGPAFSGNQGLLAARLRRQTVDGPPSLAAGDLRDSAVSGYQSCFAFSSGIRSGPDSADGHFPSAPTGAAR